MSKVFLHIDGSDEYDSRIEEIPEYILSFFSSKLGVKPILYIIDPYLNPYEMLYRPIQENSFDNEPYSKTLKNLYECNQAIEFKVITDFDLSQLISELPKDSLTKYNYARFFFDKKLGKTEVIRYPSKEGKYPQVLHDRWLILQSDGEFSGLHLGPSLNEYKTKDFTITVFGSGSAEDAGKRFEHIWQIFAGWVGQ